MTFDHQHHQRHHSSPPLQMTAPPRMLHYTIHSSSSSTVSSPQQQQQLYNNNNNNNNSRNSGSIGIVIGSSSSSNSIISRHRDRTHGHTATTDAAPPHGCASHVLTDLPGDIHSRWVAHLPSSSSSSSTATTAVTTAATDHPFLEIDIGRPAIVTAIRFGKHCKPVGANMKEFKLLGALDQGQFVCDLLKHGQQQQHDLTVQVDTRLGVLGTQGTEDVNQRLLLSSDQSDLAGTVATLKNDEFPETLSLRTTVNDAHHAQRIHFPCRYIRLLPLSSWDGQQEVNVWSIQLFGWDDEELMQRVVQRYRVHMEREAVRLCLKFFRQSGYSGAFQTLLQEHLAKDASTAGAGSQGNILEHELLTELHQALVVGGDFEASERILHRTQDLLQAATQRHDAHIARSSLCNALRGYEWNNLNVKKAELRSLSMHEPCKRGGHQMVIDEQEQAIYVYGGWDGRKDLGDLWKYDIRQHTWELLFCYDQSISDVADGGGARASAEDSVVPPSPEYSRDQFMFENAGSLLELHMSITRQIPQERTAYRPIPRSCHKMCLCTKRKRLYMIGRYLEPHKQQQMAQNNSIFSDFFYWDISNREWVLLSRDTLTESGPPVIYNHQMCIDEEKQMIYVFGGQIIQAHVQQYQKQMQARSHQHQQNEQRTTSSADDQAADTVHNGGAPLQIDANQFYAGLYSYDIQKRVWTLLRNESLQPSYSLPLKSRIGHSMVFDKKSRNLVIFGGIRNKEIMDDLNLYNVDTDMVLGISNFHNSPFQSQHSSSQYPAPETQQITFDPELHHMHILTVVNNERKATSSHISNMTEDLPIAKSSIKNGLWMCQLPLNSVLEQQQLSGSPVSGSNSPFSAHGYPTVQFEKVLDLEKSPYLTSVLTKWSDGSNGSTSMPSVSSVSMSAEQAFNEPCPRFAHQFIYDSTNKVHYLFGGNPGDDCSPDVRLNDLWKLQLKFSIGEDGEHCMDDGSGTHAGENDGDFASSQKILQFCNYLLRRQRYMEMCSSISTTSNAMQPLQFLREHVSLMVDQSNSAQIEDFRRLASLVMFSGDQHDDASGREYEQRRKMAIAKQRADLYNQLLQFFPAFCKQPSLDLMSLVQFCELR